MTLDKLATALLSRAELAAGVGLVGLLLLGVVTMADVALRWFFSSPIYGMSDLVELVTPAIVASCLPAAFAARQNITIRFLGRALGARAGQAVELAGQAVALLIVALIVWEISKYTANMIRFNQVTWLLKVPVWPTWVLTTVLLAACLPIQLLVVWETLSDLLRGRALRDELHVSDT